MKELITEGLSKYVYHFTDLNSLNSIIETNTIYLSPADSKADKSCQPKDYNFFLSLTTQSSFEIGYAGKKNNIKSNASESDEYKRVNANTQRGFSQLGINPLYRELPNDTEEPPTDYTFKVKSDDGKSDIFIKDKNQSQNRQAISTNSETEERIFSKTRYFKNVYDFIKRIDISPQYSPLCVRICFEGEKLERAFKTGRVDFLYQKYRNSMDPNQQKRARRTIKEVQGRKPKLDGYKGRDKHNRLFRQSDWDILYSWLKPLLRNKKNSEFTATETIDSWYDKIFIHVNKHTSNLGSLILDKENFKERYNNKDEGILSSDYLKDLVRTNGSNKEEEDYTKITDTEILNLLLFLYKKYGENNIDTIINGFKGEKFKNEKGKITDFYAYLSKVLKTPAFEKYLQKYGYQYENIKRRLNRGDALKKYGLKIGNIIYNMLYENTNRISITEHDIKYMVNEIIDRLKNKNPHK
jgi:hypothetical protein